MKSQIEFKNGKPFINIDGELHYPLAYTTYFDECAEYSDFISHGYRMFFVNVSFTDKPINNQTGFTPFLTGVFEKDVPDYSEFDNIVRNVLRECPDALIFPRINIAMPRKWIENNPYECVETPTGMRESLCSDKFLNDGTELLKELVSHIRSADYCNSIAGYQICGGTTQEWMHHDLFGSFSDMGLEKFKKWMLAKYGIENADVPSRETFTKGIVNDTTRRYVEFSNEMAASAINHFAEEIKEYINNEQIVGAFYGYSAFVGNSLYGLHGLHHIIDSPYIDFFSSPCAYDNVRQFGVDWGDMISVDSLKLHGKLAFIECDIRTHLTRRMQDSRPGRYSDDGFYLTEANGNKTVWGGPETVELSLSAIRKAFVHQLTKSSGIWWFDMWGGWYHDEKIMDEISTMKVIADSSVNKNCEDYPHSDVVIFVDEKAYANIPYSNPLDRTVSATRVAMGNTGIPFDLCMVEDFSNVINKYKTAIFTAPIPSENGKNALQMCKEMNLPYITITEEKLSFSTDELRDFLVNNGVHCYNNDGNVVFCGGGYVGIHSVNDGIVNISLPEKYNVRQLFGTGFSYCETDKISMYMKKHDTVLFELFRNELWDIYDINRKKTGRTVERGKPMSQDEYHIVVNVWIKNADGKWLISKRSPNKHYGNLWECCGGSAVAGEDSLTAAIREAKEELGIDLKAENGYLFTSAIRQYRTFPDFLDVWVFNQDVDINTVVLQEGETCDAKFATSDEILAMEKNDKFIPLTVFPYLEKLFESER